MKKRFKKVRERGRQIKRKMNQFNFIFQYFFPIHSDYVQAMIVSKWITKVFFVIFRFCFIELKMLVDNLNMFYVTRLNTVNV